MTDREPFLLRVAALCVGLSEIPGASSNPVILRWARDIGAPKDYRNDDTPWCAVAMNRWAQACGYPLSGSGYDLVRAKSFATWGQPCTPTLGAVLVFERPEGHHVGLYAGEGPTAFYVLGGNQGNAVSYTWIARSRLIACRWPSSVAPPSSPQTVLVAGTGPLSGNEA